MSIKLPDLLSVTPYTAHIYLCVIKKERKKENPGIAEKNCVIIHNCTCIYVCVVLVVKQKWLESQFCHLVGL